jgi:hypothetical protein
MVGDNDLIAINGMEVTGRMARELGLLGQAFLDDDLSAGATARAALQDKQAAHRTPVQKVVDDIGSIRTASETEEQEDKLPDAYSTTTQGLREAVEAGHMSAHEATVYDTLAAEMAMTNINAVEAATLHLDLATGQISEQDVDAQTKQTLDRYEAEVIKASEKAVVNEVGPEGLQFIRETMRSSPDVYLAARNFAVMRATGQSQGLTWSDFVRDVRGYMGHG